MELGVELGGTGCAVDVPPCPGRHGLGSCALVQRTTAAIPPGSVWAPKLDIARPLASMAVGLLGFTMSAASAPAVANAHQPGPAGRSGVP